ncbi:unnamed protein product [Protopolystoma xenopodis]|uniref:Uncharacterized protein n=1 Tax=Protopolystoma xenopodis TaxID=117903 RepID=A0A448WFK9_9PLAT|nr:unnamed protein product [Protopolystoma xenopodis]
MEVSSTIKKQEIPRNPTFLAIVIPFFFLDSATDSNLASAPVVSGLHSSGLEQVRYWRSVATAARAEAAGQRSRAHSLAAELAHLRCDLDMAELEIGLLWQRLASSQADLADCHAVLTASLRLTQKKQQSLPIPISLSSALPQIKLAEAGLRPPQSKLWPEFEPSLSTRTLCNPSCNQSRGSQMLQTELPP